MKQQLLNFSRVLPVALAAILSVPGCSESVDQSQARKAIDKTPASTEIIEKKLEAKNPVRNKGVVKSAALAGGYSYIEVDISGDIFWLATAITRVKPGDSIVWNSYAMMTNFRSQALNKEFDQILFVDRIMAESDLANQSHSGVVIESMSSAGYSYILVEENGTRIWLAAPETKIEIGQSIRWNSGAPMRNFTSQTLNRNFDEIFFVNTIQVS